jgi:hypothetical protein
MSIATPTRLRNLQQMLGPKPHREVLDLYLHQTYDNLFRDAVLVTLHRNWSDHAPHVLTEIGITTYTRKHVNDGLPYTAGAHAINLLENVWSMHLRIRKNAHLPSNGSDPEAFHFGSTVFVTEKEAKDMLDQIWHQPLEDGIGAARGYRPVICLIFGDNDALGKARNVDFDFVPSQVNTTVAVINAQNIAVQARMTSSQDPSIDYILSTFNIRAVDVGNAGNAAMYINTLAFMSVLRDHLYASKSNPKARPAQTGQSVSRTAYSVMEELSDRPTHTPPWGVTTYCTRCASYEHVFAECPNTDFVCTKCLGSAEKWRQDNADTHKEGLCVARSLSTGASLSGQSTVATPGTSSFVRFSLRTPNSTG